MAIGDQSSFAACTSFGCSEYVIRLEDLRWGGSGLTVEVFLDIIGNGLIDSTTVEIFVNNTKVHSSNEGQPSSDTRTFSVNASPGDSIKITYTTANVDERTVSVSGVAPSLPRPTFESYSVTGGTEQVSISYTVKNNAPVTGSFNVYVTEENYVHDSFNPLEIFNHLSIGPGGTDTNNVTLDLSNTDLQPGDDVQAKICAEIKDVNLLGD